MKKHDEPSTALCVPISLRVLLLDRHSAARLRFSRPSVDYSLLPHPQGNEAPYLGSAAVATPLAGGVPRTPGAYLHWTLPDSLTRATRSEDGRMVFPNAPTRWTVTRIPIHDGTPRLAGRKQWLIESDALSFEKPAHPHATILMPPPRDRETHTFAYLGRVRELPLDDVDDEPSGGRLANLSAVGPGQIDFAAFAPNCASVFAFYDSEGAPDEDGADSLQYQYTVVGHYDRVEDDPAYGRSLSALLDQMHWAVEEAPESAESPIYTLYHSTVVGVPATGGSCCDVPSSSGMHIAFGNTAAEALSAMVAGLLRRSQDSDGDYDIEDLLNALQLDLLSTEHPNLFDPERLRDELHKAAFRAVDAPTVWTIKPVHRNDDDEERPTIPPERLEELAKLQALQRAYERKENELAQRRDQLFADWARYLRTLYRAGAHVGEAAESELPDRIYNLMFAEAKQLEVDSGGHSHEPIQRAVDTLAGRLAPHYTVEGEAGERHWVAADPVVLIAWKHGGFSERFGGDGRFRDDGRLPCRLGSQLAVSAAKGASRAAASASRLHYQDSLVEETLQLQADATELSAGSLKGDVRPAPSGIVQWQDPWEPLRLEWQARFNALVQLRKLDDRYPKGWLHSAFSWRERELESTGERPDGGSPYSGATVVNPGAMGLLDKRLEDLIARLPREQFQRLIEKLEEVRDCMRNVPLLSQGLAGFHHALLQRTETETVDVRDPFGFRQTWEPISKAICDNNTHETDANARFNPLRAGLATVPQLRLSDANGKILDIDLANRGDLSLYVARSMALPSSWGTAGRGQIYVPPRISQAARLRCSWTTAKGSDNPIAGWLMANFVDASLMVYDHDGHPLGSLVMTEDRSRVVWRNAPGIGDPQRTIQQALAKAREDLRGVVLRLYRGDGNNEAGMLAAFMSTMELSSRTMDPAETEARIEETVLVGRPMVLARPQLKLTLPAYPRVSQSWEALDKTIEYQRNNPGPVPYPKRPHHDFTHTEFPLRMGRAAARYDGLVGYFPSDNVDTFLAELAPTGGAGHPAVQRPTLETTPSCTLVDDAPAARPLLLFDPRYSVQISTGVLPTTNIRIERSHYEAALRALEVTFLVSPLLTPTDPYDLPLPNLRLGSWSFLEWRDDAWVETPAVRPPDSTNGNVRREAIATSGDEEQRNYAPLSVLEGWMLLRRAKDEVG